MRCQEISPGLVAPPPDLEVLVLDQIEGKLPVPNGVSGAPPGVVP